MMVKMLDGIGKIVEGYNSVLSAIQNNRAIEINILEKKIESNKVQNLIKVAKQEKVDI